MKIYCEIKLDFEEKKAIQEFFETEDLVFADELKENQESCFLDSDICFGNIAPTWITKSKKLKWIQLESVGFAPYLTLKGKNIPLITNLRGFFAIPVAESALAGILALYRGLNDLYDLKEKKVWEKERIRKKLRTLHGRKVVILGAGSIALHLKNLFSVFDCNVKLFVKNRQDVESFTVDNLNEFLANADIVVGCLPETPKTTNLLNNESLAVLHPSTIVVNVGRGSLIDEKVLINKLNNRSLAGAVLDVTQIEPLPNDHLLWDCPNTILTQHTGGGLENETLGKINFFYDNYKRFIQNLNLLNIVDLNKGY